MKLCRFESSDQRVRIGLIQTSGDLLDLTAAGVESLSSLLEAPDSMARLEQATAQGLPSLRVEDVRILAPVERQEVWAAGVTYLRSKKARMDESDFSASAYDRVYEAERPELFFKSLP